MTDDETDDEDQEDEEDLDVGDNPYRHGELTSNEATALADSPDNSSDAGNAAEVAIMQKQQALMLMQPVILY